MRPESESWEVDRVVRLVNSTIFCNFVENFRDMKFASNLEYQK
jgi:hypothetical protein